MRASWIPFSLTVFLFVSPGGAQQEASHSQGSLTSPGSTKLVWKQGTVTLHENGTATVLGEAMATHRPTGAYRLVLGPDGLVEVHYEDGSRLELRSTCDVTLTPTDGQKVNLAFASFSGMALQSTNVSFVVELPSRYSFRAHQCFVEVRHAEDGRVVLSNYGGTPLLIYEGDRAVDTLAAGLRGFLETRDTIHEAREASPSEESKPIRARDDRREWAYQELVLPAGVDAIPSAGALELIATEDLTRSAVARYGSIFFLMGPKSKVVISRAGRVLGVHGAVSIIQSRTDWSRVFGVTSPFSPFSGGASGSMPRADVSDAAAGSPGSGN